MKLFAMSVVCLLIVLGCAPAPSQPAARVATYRYQCQVQLAGLAPEQEAIGAITLTWPDGLESRPISPDGIARQFEITSSTPQWQLQVKVTAPGYVTFEKTYHAGDFESVQAGVMERRDRITLERSATSRPAVHELSS